MPASDIEWAVSTWSENSEAYEVCEAYFAGDHPLTFATEKFRNTFGTLFQKLRDNLCPAVVYAEADRLYVSGWDGDGAKEATELAAATSLDRTIRSAVKNSVMQGDGYILVSESDNESGVQFWEHTPQCIVVEYDDEDDPTKMVRAAKIWENSSGLGRLNLYYEDGVEKFQTNSKITSGMPEKRTRWKKIGADDYDYGRPPIFHFAHDADLGDMGTSLLKDVIPLQDCLNKSTCDMMVAGEFVAFPQRWATGLQIDIDEDSGRPRNPPFTPGVDRIWTAAGDVKFGQFTAGEMSQFVQVQQEMRKEIARVTGVPTHMLYLDEQWPTGEAMKTAEGRLVKRIEAQQQNYNSEAKAMMNLGLQIAGKGEKKKLVPVWANAAPHSPLLDAETELVMQQVGVSKKESLRRLGFSDDKIEEMMTENEEEAQKKAELALKNAPPVDPNAKPTPFNRNGPPGQQSKVAPQQQQQKMPVPKQDSKAKAVGNR